MSPRWNWDSPTPLAASECALPPGPKGGGDTLACGYRGGGVPIPTTGETAGEAQDGQVQSVKRTLRARERAKKVEGEELFFLLGIA